MPSEVVSPGTKMLRFLTPTEEWARRIGNPVSVPAQWPFVFAALPPQVKTIYARADSGFYCGEAVEAYQSQAVQFIVSARKTSRLVEALKAADWKRSPHTDADGQCE